MNRPMADEAARASAIELLREWYSTYGGSTDTKGKPVDKGLDERTEELLRALDRTTKP